MGRFRELKLRIFLEVASLLFGVQTFALCSGPLSKTHPDGGVIVGHNLDESVSDSDNPPLLRYHVVQTRDAQGLPTRIAVYEYQTEYGEVVGQKLYTIALTPLTPDEVRFSLKMHDEGIRQMVRSNAALYRAAQVKRNPMVDLR